MSQPPEQPPERTPPGHPPPAPPPAPHSPSQYPPAPYQPVKKPSSKKNVGLIIGLIAAGVLALSAVIIGIVVLVSGDDGPTAGAPSSSESTNPSQDAAADNTGRLSGEGYSYTLPDEWEDVSEDVLAQDPPGAIDTVSTWGPDIESGRANLIVERQSAEVSDPEVLRENWQGNLGNAVGVTPKPGPDTQIAGEKVITATLESVNNQDVSVAQTAYLAVVDGAVYSITLSAEKGDTGAKNVFDKILDSWTWE